MGKSSKDKRDAYYRLAKEQGWRARSAFKLIQLDEEFNLFEGVTRVVDLCAAPGSWSQVLSRVLIKGEKFGRRAWEEKVGGWMDAVQKIEGTEAPQKKQENEGETCKDEKKNVKIVAIDLQPMAPLEGITQLKADITHPSTVPLLLQALDPETYNPDSEAPVNPVDLVISDGAPDVTGLHDLDIYVQSQLLWSALNLALCVLKPGGKFVAKIFRGKDVDLIYAQLKVVFERVHVAKPRSSRASSLESFVVCEGFCPPKGWKASLHEPLGVGRSLQARKEEAEQEVSKEDQQQGRDVIVEQEKILEKIRPATTSQDVEIVIDYKDDDLRWVAPFLACGDLSAWDSDATYHLPKDHVSLDPVQPPTAPPYKRALEMRRAAGGANGKTKPNK